MYKIAIIGPESTGKSELAKKLAEYFNVPFVAEYAREYVEKLSRPYTFRDVCRIAHHQMNEEISFENDNYKPDIIFFDTELIITKVWLQYCFDRVPRFVSQRLKKGYFDLYLLCEPDIPWQPDPVRENGNNRQFFFDWYQREIELIGKPYVIINGTGEKRTENAIAAVRNVLNFK